uniref:Uncharacterized protein n=1 Tax=Plectus sambesii TaxID=2011161 RepID=A0A914VP91_9BILA
MDSHSGGGDELGPSTSHLRERSTSNGSLMKRTLSFQLRRKSDAEQIDPKQLLAIKWRYKDISKQIIWVECPMTVSHLNKGYVEIRPPSYDTNQLENLTINGKEDESPFRPVRQGATSSGFSPPSKSALVKSTVSDRVPSKRILHEITDGSDEDDDNEPAVQITRL